MNINNITDEQKNNALSEEIQNKLKKLGSTLIPLYQSILPDLYDWQIPEETIATCNNCVLACKPESGRVDTKCCNYKPFLPAYHVGASLLDDNKGKYRIIDKIDKKEGAGQLGLYANKLEFDALSAFSKKNINKELLTKVDNDSILCGFYDKGQCTIYNYRNGVCSTFYCSSVGGNVGMNFWNALKSFLTNVEVTITNYIQNQINLDSIKREEFNTKKGFSYFERLNESNNLVTANQEYYLQCYAIFQKTDKSVFIEIIDKNLKEEYKKLEAAYQAFLDPEIPNKIKINENVETLEIGSTWTLKNKIGNVELNGVAISFLKAALAGESTKSVCDKSTLFGINFREYYLKPLILNELVIAE